MNKNYVLFDYENLQPATIPPPPAGGNVYLVLFLGPNHTRLPLELVRALQKFGDHVEYVQLESTGKNALDFHIAFTIGMLSEREPKAHFHIISNDKGFDPLTQTLRTRKLQVARCTSLDLVPCLRPTGSGVARLKPVPAPKKKKTPSLPASAAQADVQLALVHLQKMKAARPGKIATLRSSLMAYLKATHSELQVDGIITALVEQNHIARDINDSVTYKTFS